MITSRSNALVKTISQLRHRKGRNESGVYIVEGAKFVKDALRRQSPYALLVTPDMSGDFPTGALVHPDIMSYISDVKTPQGVIALFELPDVTSTDLTGEERILYLNGVQSADNVGALARTAVCAGFTGILTDFDTADLFSPKAVRASATAVMTLKVSREGIDALHRLKGMGYRIIGADVGGEEGFSKQEGRFVLAIGSEGRGLSRDVIELCSERVRLPILGDCESLNAAVAGGILMYKAAGL